MGGESTPPVSYLVASWGKLSQRIPSPLPQAYRNHPASPSALSVGSGYMSESKLEHWDTDDDMSVGSATSPGLTPRRYVSDLDQDGCPQIHRVILDLFNCSRQMTNGSLRFCKFTTQQSFKVAKFGVGVATLGQSTGCLGNLRASAGGLINSSENLCLDMLDLLHVSAQVWHDVGEYLTLSCVSMLTGQYLPQD
eukprot:GFYU01005673.1.p1 GENE.GFYU01005673.1~~GFYU01005673.1.p1  ORF type:complete len:194 (+),score=32.51 GFYU01005673.1:149-730(+)